MDQKKATARAGKVKKEPTSADYYFDSYSHYGIHEEMIKDSVRTRSYEQAILRNRFLFQDKIVMDVGAGTGILSMFCAKAGAKHVYAIECSDIADKAKVIVEVNGFKDVITVVKSKLEEITIEIPPVDIIVSEWMGYFLLYESMLNTVLYARDKWLTKGGIILPDQTSLYITAIEDEEYKNEKIHFWDNVYGFNMSVIKGQAMQEPLVDVVDKDQMVTNDCLLKTIDISETQAGDLSFSVPFSLRAHRNDFVHALVVYFDVSFNSCHKQIYFSTGPRHKTTHWKQSVLYLEDVIAIREGEILSGTVSVSPNEDNPRDLEIVVSYECHGEHCSVSRTQHYKMR